MFCFWMRFDKLFIRLRNDNSETGGISLWHCKISFSHATEINCVICQMHLKRNSINYCFTFVTVYSDTHTDCVRNVSHITEIIASFSRCNDTTSWRLHTWHVFSCQLNVIKKTAVFLQIRRRWNAFCLYDLNRVYAYWIVRRFGRN